MIWKIIRSEVKFVEQHWLHWYSCALSDEWWTVVSRWAPIYNIFLLKWSLQSLYWALVVQKDIAPRHYTVIMHSMLRFGLSICFRKPTAGGWDWICLYHHPCMCDCRSSSILNQSCYDVSQQLFTFNVCLLLTFIKMQPPLTTVYTPTNWLSGDAYVVQLSSHLITKSKMSKSNCLLRLRVI